MGLAAFVLVPALFWDGAAGRALGVDQHTIALRLFDDSLYLNALLTDAGPDRYGLRIYASPLRQLSGHLRLRELVA